MNRPSTSIIIPTWQRPLKLSHCLEGLVHQTIPPDEVVIVYRAEDSETQKIIENYDQRLLIKKVLVSRAGVIVAENAGIKAAQYDLLLFIDDDAVAPVDWIEKIVLRFKKDLELAALGGSDNIVGNEDIRQEKKLVGKVFFFGQIIGNHHQISYGVREVDTLKGVNMAVRRSLTPLLDENLQSEKYHGNGFSWELDLCLTIKRYKGKILFDPSLEVQHYSNHSHVLELPTSKNNARNLTYLFLKHFKFWQLCACLLYFTFIGNARIMGTIRFLIESTRSKAPFYSFKVLLMQWRGVIEGIKLFFTSSKQ